MQTTASPAAGSPGLCSSETQGRDELVQPITANIRACPGSLCPTHLLFTALVHLSKEGCTQLTRQWYAVLLQGAPRPLASRLATRDVPGGSALQRLFGIRQRFSQVL